VNEQERLDRIERYLRELDRELEGVPSSRRRELLDDVRGHIEEAWAESPDRSQAAFFNILERLGDTRALAREERERLGIPEAPERQGPGLLEVAAIVLTVFFWPVGILLAWLSPRWHSLDKLVATLIPVVGFALLLASTLAASVVFTSGPTVVTSAEVVDVRPAPEATGPADAPQVQPGPVVSQPVPPSQDPSWWRTATAVIGRTMVLFGLIGAPFTAALYLALRMQPRPRRAALLLPAAAGVMLAFVFLMVFLSPVVV
jgi:uncharacterized membrane protein